jgi:hypothetical protein
MCGTIICYCGLPMGKCIFEVQEKPDICTYCGETIIKVVHLNNKHKAMGKLFKKTLTKKRKRGDLRLITLYFQFICQQNTQRLEKTYLPLSEPPPEEETIETCSRCVFICYCSLPMKECFYQKYYNPHNVCTCGNKLVIKHYNLSSSERDRRDIPLARTDKYQKRHNQILVSGNYCCMNGRSSFEQEVMPWEFS